MKRLAPAALLLASLLAPTVAQAQEQELPANDPRAGLLLGDETLPGVSIAGMWAPRRDECFGPGMVTLTPRSLSGMGMACAFDRIVRKGGVVIFHGTCDRGQGAMPESVETILVSSKISFGFARAGNTIEALSRCLHPQ